MKRERSLHERVSRMNSKPTSRQFHPQVEAVEKRLLLTATEVTTYHNDNARDGQDLNEPTLTVANVGNNGFDKLFADPTDGAVYAQPLYMPNLAIPGKGTHNVVFVATAHDSVYAYDADTNGGSNAIPLWKTSLLINPSQNSMYPSIAGHLLTTVRDSYFTTSNSSIAGGSTYDDVTEMGIVGTPVIDDTSNTMYVSYKLYDNTTHLVHAYIAALNLTTGQPQTLNSQVVLPQDISVQLKSLDPSGDLNFDTSTVDASGNPQTVPAYENQRSALLLSNDHRTVYVAFSSYGDINPTPNTDNTQVDGFQNGVNGTYHPKDYYHGWLMGFASQSLQLTSDWDSTPNGANGGIWMAGGGPAMDAQGNIYLVTGNGTNDQTDHGVGNTPNDPNNGSSDYGDAMVELTPQSGASSSNGRGMVVTNHYTDPNQTNDINFDLDLGAGGVTILPDGTVVVAGKAGRIYAVNFQTQRFPQNDSNGVPGVAMPGWTANPSNSTVPVNDGTAAYFSNSLYFAPNSGIPLGYNVSAGTLQASTSSTFNPNPKPGIDPYASLQSPSISAASASTGGIVWAVIDYDPSLNPNSKTEDNSNPQTKELVGFDATNLSRVVYQSYNLLNPLLQNISGTTPAPTGPTAGGAPTIGNLNFIVPTIANGKIYVADQNSIAVFGFEPWVSSQPSTYRVGVQDDFGYLGGTNADEGYAYSPISFYTPSNESWSIINLTSTANNHTTGAPVTFGQANALAVPFDENGTGVTNFATYQPSTGQWLVNSLNGNQPFAFGSANQIPVPGDYSNASLESLAVYNPTNATWTYNNVFTSGSTVTQVVGSQAGDIPVQGDYFGQGYPSLAVYRPSTGTWIVQTSATTSTTFTVGTSHDPSDIPVPGKYTDGGYAVPAIYRQSTGQWLIGSKVDTTQANDGQSTPLPITWGVAGSTTAIPVPADYLGNGEDQIAFYGVPSGSAAGSNPEFYIYQIGNAANSSTPSYGLGWYNSSTVPAGTLPLEARPSVLYMMRLFPGGGGAPQAVPAGRTTAVVGGGFTAQAIVSPHRFPAVVGGITSGSAAPLATLVTPPSVFGVSQAAVGPALIPDVAPSLIGDDVPVTALQQSLSTLRGTLSVTYKKRIPQSFRGGFGGVE